MFEALFPPHGRIRRFRASQRAALRAHHVGWFVVTLILVTLLAAAAGAYSAYQYGADPLTAFVIGFVVWIILVVIAVAIFAAMRVRKWARARHGSGAH